MNTSLRTQTLSNIQSHLAEVRAEIRQHIYVCLDCRAGWDCHTLAVLSEDEDGTIGILNETVNARQITDLGEGL